MGGQVGPGGLGSEQRMNGRTLARTLGYDFDRKIHGLDNSDGRSAVVAGYSVGPGSVLVQSSTQLRPPGSPVWWTRLDPRQVGDGPSYLIESSMAARFVPLVVPPVPSAAELETETALRIARGNALAEELDESDLDYWLRAYWDDTTSSIREAPGVFGSAVGAIASGGIRAVTGVVGGAAGAFYGGLPFWLQVGIPVALVLAGVAGAAVNRSPDIDSV